MDPSSFLSQPFLDVASIIICLVLSGFFSGSETALTSITPARAQRMIDQGGAHARAMQYWVRYPNRLLTTILIGNNLANILASALMTRLAQSFFANSAIAIAVGIMTFLVLFFGEITPKIFARTYAERLAVPLVRILVVFYYVVFPLAWLFVLVTRKMFDLTGASAGRRGPFVSQKEIEYLISLASRTGELHGEQGKYLKSLVDFPKLRAKDVMIPRGQMVALDFHWNYDKVTQDIQEHGHTRYPVYDSRLDNIVGVLHAKDLLIRDPELDIDPSKWHDKLHPTRSVSEHRRIDDLLDIMRKNKVHMVMVRDENNSVAGLLTMEDILEELVGEIADEYDTEEDMPPEPTPDDLIVDADESIRDLNRSLGLDLPDTDEYQNLNGFLLSHTQGQIPAKDTHIIFGKWTFRIAEIADGQISKVEILDNR